MNTNLRFKICDSRFSPRTVRPADSDRHEKGRVGAPAGAEAATAHGPHPPPRRGVPEYGCAKLPALTLVIALLRTVTQITFAADPAPEPRLSGLRELSAEELADFHARMFVKEPPRTTLAPLPARHLNITHLPAVRSQGALGSCAAFGSTYYYKTYQEAREHGWIRPDPETHPQQVASPMWTYNLCPQVQLSDQLWAISHYDALQLITERGVATWADMPYADTNDIKRIPDDLAIWRRAMDWRAASMGRIPDLTSPHGLNLLKHHLAGGDLAVVAIGRVTHAFDAYPDSTGANGIHNGVYFRDHGYNRSPYGHSLTVVGYDDNMEYTDDRTGETRRGALLLVNSWGTGWGIHVPEADSAGFIWIAYDYVLGGGMGEDMRGLGSEALIMEDRIGYQPETIAVVGIDYSTAPSTPGMTSADLVNMSAFEIQTMRGSRRPFPHINHKGTVQRLFPVDITDLATPPVSRVRFWLAMPTDPAGILTDFWLEDGAGNVRVTSERTPLTLDTNDHFAFPGISVALDAFHREAVGLEELRIYEGQAAFADVNGNHHADLIVTGSRHTPGTVGGVPSTTLWLNQGNGTFVQSPAAFPGTMRGAVVWSDVNNSGAPDLWLAGETDTRLYWNDGAGSFTDSGLRLPSAHAGCLAVIDYNRDGRPDLAIGSTNGVFLYRQNYDATFTRIVIDPRGMPPTARLMPHGAAGALAWGDLDGNGLPDLLVTGLDDNIYENVAARTVIYRNNGDDTFSIAPLDLPGLVGAAVAWSDFDNDGIDDLAISGAPSDVNWGNGVTHVFRGRGDGTFEAVDAVDHLRGLYRGAIQWVDLDNSGRRDLLLNGREYIEQHILPSYPYEWFPNRLRVWRNRGGQAFEKIDAGLPGVSGPGAAALLAVADVSGDGSADIFASGIRTRSQGPLADDVVESFLLRNRSAVYPTHGGTNAAPTAPTAFNAVALGHGAVTFLWSGATDDTTPAAGLRYILRLGSAPEQGDVVSGIVPPCDYGRLVRSGVTYRDLPSGTLYWSVRTVDAALAVSPWSATQTVSVPAYTRKVWLRVERAPAYGGSTDPAGSVQVARDGTVSINAIPAAGFEFSHWSGAGAEGATANPLSWTATYGGTVTAHFKIKPNPAAPLWTQITDIDGEPFAPVALFGAVMAEYNGRLYHLGGIQRRFPANPPVSRVYSADAAQAISQSAIHWTEHSIDGMLMPSWAELYGSGRSYPGVQVYNNRLWLIGGTGRYGPFNDAWWTTDGDHWTAATTNAPWIARHHAASAVFNDQLWVIGGLNASNQRLRDAWSSTDGDNWTRVIETAPWEFTRAVALSLEDRLFLLLYPATVTEHNPQRHGETWTTIDGNEWTRISENGPWQQNFRAVAFENRLIVAVGPDASSEHAGHAIWESDDGIDWVRTAPQPDTPHWTAREAPALAVGAERVWMIGGRDTDGTNDSTLSDVWHYGSGTLPDGVGQMHLSAVPRDGGMLEPPAGTYADAVGSLFHLRAQPAAGYRFDGWEGPVSDPAATTTTVTLASDTVVNARFVSTVEPVDPEVILTLAVWPPEAGATTPAMGDHVGPRYHVRNLRVTPATGWRFSHWDGPVREPRLAATTVTVESNTVVTAYFKRQALAAGVAHTSLIRDDGTLWIWGHGHAGQSGRGSGMTVGGLPPLAERAGIRSIAAGQAFTMAAESHWQQRQLLVWGAPWTASRPPSGEWELDPYALTADQAVMRLAAGGNVIALLDVNGLAYAAGEAMHGQLGGRDGHDILKELAPVKGVGGYGALSNIVDIAVGGAHVLAVDTRGRVFGWGRNTRGEIDPMQADRLPTPVPVPNLPPIHSVVASGETLMKAPRSYALDVEGRVWQWGAGFAMPVQVLGLPSDLVTLAAGGRHVLALDAGGNVYAWGENGEGQIGDGTRIDRDAAVPVAGLPKVVEIAAGFMHSAALAEDGRVFVWGDNSGGAVTGEPGETVTTPIEIEDMHAAQPTFDFTLIATPEYGGTIVPRQTTYRARTGGELPLRAIPAERYQFDLWDGMVADLVRTQTVSRILGGERVEARFSLRLNEPARLTLSAEPAHAGLTTPPAGEHDYPAGAVVPLRADHAGRWRFAGWDGDVADPAACATQVSMHVDRQVIARFDPLPFATLPGLSAHAPGVATHLMLLDKSGAVRLAVPHPSFALGIASIQSYNATPVMLPDGLGPLSNIVQVVLRDHSLARHADGTVYAWGNNAQGQCGRGNMVASLAEPAPVLGPDDAPLLVGIRQVAAAAQSSIALTLDGAVYQWGRVSGHAHETVSRPVPLLDGGGEPLDGFVRIAAGPDRMAAVRADGVLWMWTLESAPEPVAGLSAVSDVSIGPGHTLALLANGTVRAWGDNAYGQLGNGTTDASTTPVNVQGLSQIVAVAAGHHHSLALDSAGRVYAWGRNDSRQLGDGTQAHRALPGQVAGLANIRAIDATERASFSLDSQGQLFYWGIFWYQTPFQYIESQTPMQDPWLALGDRNAQMVRLNLRINDPAGGHLFPGIGTFLYNRGQTVELRATPTEDYRLLRWSDGNTNLWREVTLIADLDLTAEFILIEPTIRLDHTHTGPGTTARMRVMMEDGKWPYAGFNAAILLPPGVDLLHASHGIDLHDGFVLDTVTRRAPGGGTLLSLAAFSPDEAMDARDGEWAVLTLRASPEAAGGILPVNWVDGRAWTRCPPAILADTNGVLTVRPTLVNGSVTVGVANRVHAALRIADHPAGSDRMSDNAFSAYHNRTHYLTNEPFIAEIWLRNTGTGTVGIVQASAHLFAHGFDEDDPPLVFDDPQHGAIFNLNTGGTVIDGMVSNLTGTASAGEGRGEWVRFGWAPVPAPRDRLAKSFMLAFGDQAPVLAGGSAPDDMAVLGGPITVRTLADLARAALGTPHWWLDAYGLVELGVIGYDEAEITDYRGDGFIARQAYIAGVDPTDPNSRFIVAEIARGVNRDEISWPGVAGRRYRVYRATTLAPQADWTLMHTENCDVNRIITYTYAHGLDAPRFYRIDVELIE